VVLNLEVLVYLPFLIKQRAYSLIYQELATPRIDPVFMLQLSEYFPDICERIYWLTSRRAVFVLVLDGIFTPWTLLTGAVGTAVGTQILGLIRRIKVRFAECMRLCIV
jgi:hypothetical protein